MGAGMLKGVWALIVWRRNLFYRGAYYFGLITVACFVSAASACHSAWNNGPEYLRCVAGFQSRSLSPYFLLNDQKCVGGQKWASVKSAYCK